MADKNIFPQISEGEYLADHFESVRVNTEQQLHAGYRRSLDGPMMPGVEAEGSWLNSKHNPRNGGQ